MEDVKVENQNDTSKKGKSKSTASWIILIIVVVIIGGYFMYQGGQDDFGFVTGDVLKGSLQTGADEIVLDEVTMPAGGGFVVVFETKDGARTRVGTSRYLPEGTNTNVVIPISNERRVTYGSRDARPSLSAVAYEDTNGNEEFDEASDESLTDEAGNEIVVLVELEEEIIEDPAPTDETPDSPGDDVGTSTEPEPSGDNTDPATTTDPSDDEEPVAITTPEEIATVTYTDEGFSPSTITVAIGETVRFVNNSSADFWVASAFHPSHEELPEFDQNEGGAPGTTYEFAFETVGEWGYHDHLKPQMTGTVVVE